MNLYLKYLLLYVNDAISLKYNVRKFPPNF
jgi:hypothetical protein